MAHHLEVVAPKEFVHPAVGLLPESLFELSWIEAGGFEGTLALPFQHRLPFDGLELIILYRGHWALVFE